MRNRRRAIVAAAAALVVGGLVPIGCGGGEDDDGPPTIEALLERLPAGEGATERVVAVDLAAARELAGLRPDQDILGRPAEPGPSELGSAVSAALVSIVLSSTPNPIGGALDGTRISGVARNDFYGDASVMAIATTQPFDEIAGRLTDEGFEEQDGILIDEGPGVNPFDAIGDGGDGVVLVAGSAEAVRSAVDRNDLSPESELLLKVDGTVRRSFIRPPGTCVVGVAVGDELSSGTGEAVIEIDGEADATRVRRPPLPPDIGGVIGPEITYGEPVASGNVISIPVSYEESDTATGIELPLPGATALPVEKLGARAYDCG